MIIMEGFQDGLLFASIQFGAVMAVIAVAIVEIVAVPLLRRLLYW